MKSVTIDWIMGRLFAYKIVDPSFITDRTRTALKSQLSDFLVGVKTLVCIVDMIYKSCKEI